MEDRGRWFSPVQRCRFYTFVHLYDCQLMRAARYVSSTRDRTYTVPGSTSLSYDITATFWSAPRHRDQSNARRRTCMWLANVTLQIRDRIFPRARARRVTWWPSKRFSLDPRSRVKTARAAGLGRQASYPPPARSPIVCQAQRVCMSTSVQRIRSTNLRVALEAGPCG